MEYDSLVDTSYILTRYNRTIHGNKPPVSARARGPRDAHRNADASIRNAPAVEGARL
ncbi:hypothetical protein BDI4_1930003 [Burkholderia diffusa]|nr:hypothetical protein BDI4_1930003 [Burkholderia diffusa]